MSLNRLSQCVSTGNIARWPYQRLLPLSYNVSSFDDHLTHSLCAMLLHLARDCCTRVSRSQNVYSITPREEIHKMLPYMELRGRADPLSGCRSRFQKSRNNAQTTPRHNCTQNIRFLSRGIKLNPSSKGWRGPFLSSPPRVPVCARYLLNYLTYLPRWVVVRSQSKSRLLYYFRQHCSGFLV